MSFDKSNPLSGEWIEIPTDKNLLTTIKFHPDEYNLTNPILIYDKICSPMIHGQVFGLFAFMNNDDVLESNFIEGKSEIASSVK